MIKKFLSIFFLAVFIYACSSNEGEDESIIFVDDFDRGLMLTNLARNVRLFCFRKSVTFRKVLLLLHYLQSIEVYHHQIIRLILE